MPDKELDRFEERARELLEQGVDNRYIDDEHCLEMASILARVAVEHRAGLAAELAAGLERWYSKHGNFHMIRVLQRFAKALQQAFSPDWPYEGMETDPRYLSLLEGLRLQEHWIVGSSRETRAEALFYCLALGISTKPLPPDAPGKGGG